MDKQIFVVRRPDTDRDIRVRTINIDIAKSSVALKYPLRLLCPRCNAPDGLVLRKKAEMRRKFLGLDEDSDFIMGEPTYTDEEDTYELRCEICQRDIPDADYESIVGDSKAAARKAEDKEPDTIVSSICNREGWAIFDNSERGFEIEKIDEAEKFESDDEALAFVKRCADQGSVMHIDALAFVEAHSKDKVWEV